MQKTGARVSTQAARAHINKLRAHGATTESIAKGAGLAFSTVSNIASGRQLMCAGATSELILGTTMRDCVHHVETVPVGDLVDRLRVAHARGWSQRVIGEAAGVSKTTIWRISHGVVERTLVDVAVKLDRFLRKIDGIDGPSGRARSEARKHGWDQYYGPK